MMKPMSQTPVKVRRQFDEAFKRESVQHWLQSGKSAGVIGRELGLQPNRLYSWRTAWPPRGGGGGGAGGANPRLAGRRARPVGLGPARNPARAGAARYFKKTLGILSEPSLNATNGSTR